jgi:hypothetical protein
MTQHTPAAPVRMIVVVDHHAARIFGDPDGPKTEETIKPADPHHFHHHLVHKKESHYQGDRVPEDGAFYAAIAKALTPATQIVIIGHGVGKSNAAVVLMDHLKSHHAQIAKAVVAEESADLSALTVPQIEALARKHMIES